MLYIIATPIGNLGDITARAIETLKQVDVVLCEDTRTSKKLLQHFGINTRTQSYHDHSSDSDREKVINILKDGQKVGLISDAGSPLISDPGYKLVALCQQHNIPYTTISGASSVIAAVQLSGLPSDQFAFFGFLPHKQEARKKRLAEILSFDGLAVMFETAQRITDTIEILKESYADRDIAIVREISKLYEEVIRGDAETLLVRLKEKPIKGEIVLLVGPAPEKKVLVESLDDDISQLLEHMPAKAVAKYLAAKTTLSKNDIYDYILSKKQ